MIHGHTNTCLNFNGSSFNWNDLPFSLFITCKIWFQGCQQWQRWEEWDAPWRGSLLCRKVKKRWAWVHHWLRRPARQPCQAPPWLWWTRGWALKGQVFPLVWATTFLGGSCLVCLDWSGHSTLFTHLLLKRMRSQDCPSKPKFMWKGMWKKPRAWRFLCCSKPTFYVSNVCTYLFLKYSFPII